MLSWTETAAPRASSRYDDIYFLDPQRGWAVNSSGQILHTADGGRSWQLQFQTPIVGRRPVYLRCVGFANERVGWVGTISGPMRLFQSLDGGVSWGDVKGLPADAPIKVCGLSVVSEQVVYASGTNDPADASAVMKTTDGGATWTARSMEDHAAALIDIHFFDDKHGFVVGGRADVPNATRADLVPTVLETVDGGANWTERVGDLDFPLGEWGWKLHFVDDALGFVSLENFSDGAILKTNDGGRTWQRLPVTDPQKNRNLEGIGFLDESVGWVGGWGDIDFVGGYTSSTPDGGQTWQDANEVGRFINRFRFFDGRKDVAYACGKTVYKMTSGAREVGGELAMSATDVELLVTNEPASHAREVQFAYEVPAGSRTVWLHVWDRFGALVRTVTHEEGPEPGGRSDIWDGRDEAGDAVTDGMYIYRLTVDDTAESGVLHMRGAAGEQRADP